MMDAQTEQNAKMEQPAKVRIFGVEIALTDYAEAVQLIYRWAREGDGVHLIAAANTHFVTLAGTNAAFRDALQSFDLVVPDGMPLIWYLNAIEKAGLKDRVYGPELMVRALAATDPSIRHFFLGGSEQMREKLLEVIGARHPGLKMAGSYSPPFGAWPAGEGEAICRMLRESKAQIVWVGLGCPKQEMLLHQLREQLPNAVYLAVGAAFPLISGVVRQAPPVLQRHGLEWAFRLAMEPRRLWKRYLVHNTLFVYLTLREVAGRFFRKPRVSASRS